MRARVPFESVALAVLLTSCTTREACPADDTSRDAGGDGDAATPSDSGVGPDARHRARCGRPSRLRGL